jgi:hypothetical protein
MNAYRTDVAANDGTVLAVYQGVNITANSVFNVVSGGSCRRLVRASENPSRFLIK